MNEKNIAAIAGVTLILLIVFGAVLMHRGKGEGSIENELGDAPVSTVQADAKHLNAVTNSKPSTVLSEKVPTVVESADMQPIVDPVESSSNEINIAGKNYPVVFEGQSVPSELKRTIIADLGLNLSHFQRIDFMELPPEREEPAAQMYQQKITHWLDDGKQQRYFPGTVEKYFGGAVKVGDNFQLIVHEQLVEKYKQAVKLRTERAEMFDKLDEFIKLLQNKEALDLLAKDSDASRSMLYFLGRPKPTSEAGYRTLVKSCSDLWIRPPSLLDVKPLGDLVKQSVSSGQDVYAFSTLVCDAERNPENLMKMPMGVFVEGKWRLLAMPSP